MTPLGRGSGSGRKTGVIRVLVISSTRALAAGLSRSLPPDRYQVCAVRPGSGVLRALRQERPAVAVVDGIDTRPASAQLEIELTKELCPEARVIALSGHSSPADASVVEQGLFYYMAAPSDRELERVVRAAAGEVEAAGNQS